MTTPWPSKQLYLNTKDATPRYQNGVIKSYSFYFQEYLAIPQNYSFQVSIQDAQIPYAFTSVNTENNSITLKVAGQQDVTAQIPPGNYDIDTLRTAVLLALYNAGQALTPVVDLRYLDADVTKDKLSLAYDEASNKVAATYYQGSSFTLEAPPSEGPNLLRMLGYTLDSVTGASITSDSVVDLTGITSLLIRSSLQTYNLDSKRGHYTNILGKIPINVHGNGIVSYVNTTGYRALIQERELQHIILALEDEYHRPVDMQGVDWQITLQVDVVPRPVLDKHMDKNEFMKFLRSSKISSQKDIQQDVLATRHREEARKSKKNRRQDP